MPSGLRHLGLAFAATAAALVVPAHPASAHIGTLRQLAGDAACVEPTNALYRHCRRARFDGELWDLAVSPDGRNLYAGSGSSQLLAFRIVRGQPRMLAGKAGCLYRVRRRGCGHDPRLQSSGYLTMSPDGTNLYSSGALQTGTAARLTIFARRAATGALRRLPGSAGCIGTAGSGCTMARGFRAPLGKVALSPGGEDVYVPAHGGTVMVFRRRSNGGLTQLPGAAGCLNPDGADGCTRADALLPDVSGLAVSPDARSVYVTSNDYPANGAPMTYALAGFARNPSTGTLTQLPSPEGCLSADGAFGCRKPPLFEPLPQNSIGALMISPNGRDVYVGHSSLYPGAEPAICGYEDDYLSLFSRDPVTGELGPLRQDAVACGPGMLMSPDGRSVYSFAGGTFGDLIWNSARDRQTGLLSKTDCIGPFDRSCGHTKHFDGPVAMAITPNARYAYVITNNGRTIAAFRRSLR
jgi:DNA-binding beta-propeller fold protein YncE